jgi:hypothetical protein
MTDEEEREAREAKIGTVLDVLGPLDDQNVDLEFIFAVLIDVFGFFLAGVTDGKPAGNIDMAARIIGQEIASRAHELRFEKQAHAIARRRQFKTVTG